MRRHLDSARRRVGIQGLVLCCVTLPAAVGRGEAAQWNEPAIDTWAYTNSSTSGTREFAPTFGAITVDPETDLLAEGDATGATRLGMAMVAFETNDQVEAGIDPSRYVVNSVTVTAWATKTGNGDLLYSEEPLTPTSVLDEALAGPISSQQPIELFGVGFTDEYDGFDLGIVAGESLFSEASEPYSAEDFAYDVYPVVGDGAGGYEDVSNNLAGGYSFTAPGQSTGPFQADPWAIGDGFSVNTGDIEDPGTPYNEGDVLPLITRYEFSLDLTEPGVDEYVRQGLADGALGFFLSSIHRGGQPGVPGGGAYIDWRMKEAFADFSARLAVDLTILPDRLAGDANGDGSVDLLDLDILGGNFGVTERATVDQGDFNGDGAVDLLDLDILGGAFGTTAGAIAVPEPTTGVYALAGVATVAFCVGTCVFTNSGRRRR